MGVLVPEDKGGGGGVEGEVNGWKGEVGNTVVVRKRKREQRRLGLGIIFGMEDRKGTRKGANEGGRPWFRPPSPRRTWGTWKKTCYFKEQTGTAQFPVNQSAHQVRAGRPRLPDHRPGLLDEQWH